MGKNKDDMNRDDHDSSARVIDIDAARKNKGKNKASSNSGRDQKDASSPHIPKSWNISYKKDRWEAGDGAKVSPNSSGNSGFRSSRRIGFGQVGGGAKPALFDFSMVTPAARFLLLACVIVFVIVSYALPPGAQDFALRNFAFSPAVFLAPVQGDVSFLKILSPVSYMFLHDGLMHFIFNAIMLLAFAVLVERSYGARAVWTLFFGGGLCGAGVFLAIHYGQDYALVGSSAGLSALFAAALLQMNPMSARIAQVQGRKALSNRTMILIWLGIMIVTGVMSQDVAWQAHVAGFLFGALWYYRFK